MAHIATIIEMNFFMTAPKDSLGGMLGCEGFLAEV
jgi:hypothetical protein